jgi:hypothetical protein
MVWRRKQQLNPDSLEDRYRVVARLVERQGFEPRGLIVIEVDGGFVVRGVRATGRRGIPLVVSATIAAEDLLAEMDLAQ